MLSQSAWQDGGEAATKGQENIQEGTGMISDFTGR